MTDGLVGSGDWLAIFFLRQSRSFESELSAKVAKDTAGHLIAVNQAVAATADWLAFVATFEGETKYALIQIVHLTVDLDADRAEIHVPATAGGNLHLRGTTQVDVVRIVPLKLRDAPGTDELLLYRPPARWNVPN